MFVYNIDQYNPTVKINSNLPFYFIHSSIKDGEYKDASDYYSIKTVFNSSEKYWIENSPYSLQPNKHLVVNPKQETQTFIRSNEDVNGLCMFIKPEIVRNVAAAFTLCQENLLSGIDSSKEIVFIDGLFNNATDVFGNDYQRFIASKKGKFDFSYEELTTVVEQLVVSQLRKNKEKLRVEAVKDITKKELYKRVYAAIDLIKSDYSQKLSVSSISETVGMSEYHFYRTFRQVTGTTPHDYLTGIRIEAAKKLLKKGYPAKEVAYQIGIYDIPGFSKLFKKETGITPAKFSRI